VAESGHMSSFAVEDRVHLDDLEGAHVARLGHELQGKVRLAVGETAALAVELAASAFGARIL